MAGGAAVGGADLVAGGGDLVVDGAAAALVTAEGTANRCPTRMV